jgi:tetratricopeptide (TPR) repeat protein
MASLLPSFNRQLGDLYFDDFKLESAIAEYKAAIRLEPRDIVAFKSMGFACYLSGIIDRPGMYEEAAAAFERALEISPSDAEALYGLGISYESLCDTDKAFNVYFKLKALDTEWADRLLDDLLKENSREET